MFYNDLKTWQDDNKNHLCFYLGAKEYLRSPHPPLNHRVRGKSYDRTYKFQVFKIMLDYVSIKRSLLTY